MPSTTANGIWVTAKMPINSIMEAITPPVALG